ncbi:GntP family permease [Streptomonospora nanhaiensis]|uniref:GntP family gluconate:H+ symporter/Gnt-I system low-affinity gluconate transporter n=1 Tax=Streptomonospora nanhaiensis TaxID=1323731 RepID=A0A853BR27_9ACTN|nr:gluconate:H+ symporter [Streptomonospora nanhaiensis]MBV2362242.1 GntP family permease [Streptomonospora nanhaiensis]MBX9387834.1 GntP family permease [Streptomonospora nanhaiensis]NYI97304.1 GntP family gluconate:H+ symporter/Gnt-I system low-affinity gluconate transporter [Streptomonospora nanhaiensis]
MRPLTTADPAARLLAADSPELAWTLPSWALICAVALGVGLLLLLIIRAKLHAFVALLLVSAAVGFAAGLPLSEIPAVLEDGMGATLGGIAIIVALGAMLGRMMEETGAARLLSQRLLALFGERRAPLAMGVTALVFGIPVFFDVGFIILVPLIYAVAQRSRHSLLAVALPVAGGLAMMHAVLPPHPGPVAAAELLDADLGWIAVMGLVCGLPAWYLGAYVFGTWLGRRRFVPVPAALYDEARAEAAEGEGRAPSLGLTLTIVVLPVVLILLNTFAGVLFPAGPVREAMTFVGHPISALTVATLLSFWLLGLRGGFTRERIEKAASASLGPVALVLLVTGAGGVFGEVLEATRAGEAVADLLGRTALPVIALAFLIATALRVALGSKTVAIVTTAPIVAPLADQAGLSQPEVALVVVAVAAGGTVLSHVNDSGFWLMNRYLDLDIKTTLKSWTMMETLMGVCMFAIACAISAGIALAG